MPHFVVDCSDSVLALVGPDALMRTVYEAAEATGLFRPTGVRGIKVRLRPYEHALNVDGREPFVHVFAHVMGGRTPEQKRLLAERVVGALTALLPTVEIVSMNVYEFDPATYVNATTVEAGSGAK